MGYKGVYIIRTCYPDVISYKLFLFQVRDDDQFGTVLGTFCGNTIPATITSSSNRMWVKYRTDYSVSGTGFHAAYNASKFSVKFFVLVLYIHSPQLRSCWYGHLSQPLSRPHLAEVIIIGMPYLQILYYFHLF